MTDAKFLPAEMEGLTFSAGWLPMKTERIRLGPADPIHNGRSRGAKGGAMEDQNVIDRINQLANEEHELFEKESEGSATKAERERLKWLEVSLDQCWDLLHQRRARRNAGLDPNEAQPRDVKTVEGYIG
jgi:uncharacterized protein DUF2630